jgi:membrane-bound metal-dependent hydrolase YbcI (DUF457 family)
MLIGHIAVGFASKRAAPRASLGVLMTAPILLDLLWPIALLLGIETVRIDPGNTAVMPLDFVSYPWTHSLLMSVVWGALFALLYRARTGDARAAWVIALGVVSHWVLDWVSHRPDLQLAPGLPLRVGLGLWGSRPATMLVELAMFAVGLAIYLGTTRARDLTGSISLWAFVAVVVLLYFARLQGPPPPGVRTLAIVKLMEWLFVPWAFWIDRHRPLRTSTAA